MWGDRWASGPALFGFAGAGPSRALLLGAPFLGVLVGWRAGGWVFVSGDGWAGGLVLFGLAEAGPSRAFLLAAPVVGVSMGCRVGGWVGGWVFFLLLRGWCGGGWVGGWWAGGGWGFLLFCRGVVPSLATEARAQGWWWVFGWDAFLLFCGFAVSGRLLFPAFLCAFFFFWCFGFRLAFPLASVPLVFLGFGPLSSVLRVSGLLFLSSCNVLSLKKK